MRDPNFSSDRYAVLNGDKTFTDLNNSSINIRTKLDDETKIELIEKNFREIMEILGLDLTDDSLRDTPHRVAKMYIKEIFSGLNPENKPSISLFENNYNYTQMLIEKNITLFSTCEHHFVPIVGKVHIGYFPNEYVLGLSKLNRIVQYFAKRPQQQERLTMQIAQELMNILGSDDVAVLIEADHFCVKSRGVNDVNSLTITSSFNGKFLIADIRNEFLNNIRK
jgi:GTP cyclohydrolase IA